MSATIRSVVGVARPKGVSVAEIPTADWSWINKAAERFEQAWKKGPRPRIEDFLIKVPESQWPPLLQELMRVERELRRREGEGPSAEEYRRRFPDHEDVIATVFAVGPVPDGGDRPGPAVEVEVEPHRSSAAAGAERAASGTCQPRRL